MKIIHCVAKKCYCMYSQLTSMSFIYKHALVTNQPCSFNIYTYVSQCEQVAWVDPAGSELPGMAQTPLEKMSSKTTLEKKKRKKNVSPLVETSSWLEPVTVVKRLISA